MRDDHDSANNPVTSALLRRSHQGAAQNAVILAFPSPMRQSVDPRQRASDPTPAVLALLDLVQTGLGVRGADHAATRLATLGAIAGFAAQQAVLAAGPAAWAQPARNAHLDRLLLSERASDNSLWLGLSTTARALGTVHLPDPSKLLAATLRCVGTQQMGQIILPLEYQLVLQPHTALVGLWSSVRDLFASRNIEPVNQASCAVAAVLHRLGDEQRAVPTHVAVRIILQAALAMALTDPRGVPGAASRPDRA